MKPYGRMGKLELAPCGCCAAHYDSADMFPWRNRSIRRAVSKRNKHKARQEAKKDMLDQIA